MLMQPKGESAGRQTHDTEVAINESQSTLHSFRRSFRKFLFLAYQMIIKNVDRTLQAADRRRQRSYID